MATKFEDSGIKKEVEAYPNASENMKRVCKNCNFPFGEHFGYDCPTIKERKELNELYGSK